MRPLSRVENAPSLSFSCLSTTLATINYVSVFQYVWRCVAFECFPLTSQTHVNNRQLADAVLAPVEAVTGLDTY